MAATHTPTSNPAVITVSGISDETVDLSKIIGNGNTAFIERLTGTSVQFNCLGAVVASSAAITATQTKLVLPVTAIDYLHHKGGAGSETYIIAIA